MIPIQLSLRNFLSYGENVQPLDFSFFKLACLSGRNGHGKSALLDAMTWALWGEARKAGFSRTPDADLLRLNADEMEVEFTFLLNDREYQVYRNYRRGKRGGKLEFKGRESKNESFSVLTGSSKKETQKRIIDTLGLDYRTFINSSFLQQGKADEFTRQTPAERKEILGNILGLGFYDRLLEETKQRLSVTRAEKRNLEEMLEDINQELSEEQTILEEKNRLENEVHNKEKRINQLLQEEKSLQEQITQLHIVRERISSLTKEEESLQQRTAELSNTKDKIQREQSDLNRLVSQEEKIKQEYDRYEEINTQLNKLLEVDNQYRQLDKRHKQLERTIESKRSEYREQYASLNSEQEQVQKSLEQARQIIEKRDTIETNYSAFKKIVAEEQKMENLRPQFEELSNKLQKTETKIEQEKQSIEKKIAELHGWTHRIESLKKEIDRINQDTKRLPALKNALNKLYEERKHIEEQGQATRSKIDRSKAEIERQKKIIEENEERILLLRRGETQECYVCKSPLNEKGLEELLNTYQAEIQRYKTETEQLKKQVKQDSIRRNELLKEYEQKQELIKAKENETSKLENESQNKVKYETDLKNLEAKQTEIQQLTQQLETGTFATEFKKEAENLHKSLQELTYDPELHYSLKKQLQEKRQDEIMWERLQEELKKEKELTARAKNLTEQIAQINHTLEKEDFAHSEREELSELTPKMEPLEKQLNTRSSLREEQQTLRNARSDWNQLQHAKERLPVLDKDYKDNETRLEQTKQRLSEVVKLKEESLPKLNVLQETEKQLQQKESERLSVQNDRDQYNLQLGGITEKHLRLEQRKKELKDKKEKLNEIVRDEHLYDILRKAFSRDGIPAMIVEQSLPELEEDANRILHRLTSGTCSVRMESQREKRSGGMVESLDIKISDEMGTRDYEMFSGGEAFRTDLALRIALSQLLCRRAGSKLQLLVIDEGFGSQDEEGLSYIVDAINDIQDEFEKILIVTHLEELKEKFLVRIEVHKEAAIGSRFNIVYTS